MLRTCVHVGSSLVRRRRLLESGRRVVDYRRDGGRRQHERCHGLSFRYRSLSRRVLAWPWSTSSSTIHPCSRFQSTSRHLDKRSTVIASYLDKPQTSATALQCPSRRCRRRTWSLEQHRLNELVGCQKPILPRTSECNVHASSMYTADIDY